MYSYRENFKSPSIFYHKGNFYHLPRETLVECGVLDWESCDSEPGCHWISSDNVCKSDSYSSALLGSYTTDSSGQLTRQSAQQITQVNLSSNLTNLVKQPDYTSYLDTLNFQQLVGVVTELERVIPNFVHNDKESQKIYNKMVEMHSQIQKNIMDIGGSAGGGGGTFQISSNFAQPAFVDPVPQIQPAFVDPQIQETPVPSVPVAQPPVVEDDIFWTPINTILVVFGSLFLLLIIIAIIILLSRK